MDDNRRPEIPFSPLASLGTTVLLFVHLFWFPHLHAWLVFVCAGLALTFKNDAKCSFGGIDLTRTTEVNFICDPDGVEIPSTFEIFESVQTP